MTEQEKREVLKRLYERGVRISVGGCGCCASPWVSIEIDGEDVINDEDCCGLDFYEPGDSA